MLCPTLSVKLTKWSIKYPYIVPKIFCRQKSAKNPMQKLPKNLAKTYGKNLLCPINCPDKKPDKNF